MKLRILLLQLLLFTSLFSQEQIFVIPIKGTIEPSLTVFIRNSIKEAEKGEGPIVFEIDTFGGRVDSALQITTLIGSLDNRETIAFIPSNPEGLGVSWSAGALISFACNSIYMAEGTSIGAAAPVFMTPEGSQMADEKTVSAVRVQMQSLAEKNGYPESVALAMVDKDVELYEVTRDSSPKLVVKEDLITDEESKLILKSGKLLTLTAKEMEYYSISKRTIRDFEELQGILDITETQYFEQNLSDRLVAFLTSSTILALLMTLGLITLYLEITSPGFGVLGTIGIISFAIVFIGAELLGTLDSLELLLFLGGLSLLVVEVFVIPGFGITGISGIILMGLSLILSQQDFIIPKWEWQWSIFNRNLTVLLVVFISSILGITLLLSLFPRLKLFRHLVLDSNRPDVSTENRITKEMETIAQTMTELRPVGKISIDGVIHIAKSDGPFIDQGREVYVIDTVMGTKIVKEKHHELGI